MTSLFCAKQLHFLVSLGDKTTGGWLNQKIRFENDFQKKFWMKVCRLRGYVFTGKRGGGETERQTVTERRTDRLKETGTIYSVCRLAKSSHVIRGRGTEVEEKRPRKKKGQVEMPKAIASFLLLLLLFCFVFFCT